MYTYYIIVYKRNIIYSLHRSPDVHAYLILGNRETEIKEAITIEDAVLSLEEHPDAYLYLLNGRPVPMTTVLENDMRIDAIRVASGG